MDELATLAGIALVAGLCPSSESSTSAFAGSRRRSSRARVLLRSATVARVGGASNSLHRRGLEAISRPAPERSRVTMTTDQTCTMVPMSDVFLSYALQDSEVAAQLAAQLR